jgi:hypothetical protein
VSGTSEAASWNRLQRPEFWRWLLNGEAEFEEELEFELTLMLGTDEGIRASVHEGMMVTLVDLFSGTELGWIDDFHFHPNCLRVSEALRLAEAQRAQGRHDEALLLLAAFTVATTDAELELLATSVASSWTALGLAAPPPSPTWSDFVGQSTEWFRDNRSRWCLRQAADDLDLRPLYSLRVEENPEFPAWLSAIGDASSR